MREDTAQGPNSKGSFSMTRLSASFLRFCFDSVRTRRGPRVALGPNRNQYRRLQQDAPQRAADASARGRWIQLVGRPQLEKWASPNAEPVDFTIFQADDGRWQLISCIRKTTHPGAGRLLYRWSSPKLTEGWKPEGIFLSSKSEWDHAEGRVQAPFHVKDGNKHFLFYNSRGGHLMTSEKGIDFEPFGKKAVFPMGRDVCLLDDRERSGKWIAYYTSPEKGINPATKDHTIRARTAAKLEGPWSETAVEIPPITPPPSGYKFVYAESPLVIKRGDYYYRFEQLFVYRSKDPFQWQGPPVANLRRKTRSSVSLPRSSRMKARITCWPTSGAAKTHAASISCRSCGRSDNFLEARIPCRLESPPFPNVIWMTSPARGPCPCLTGLTWPSRWMRTAWRCTTGSLRARRRTIWIRSGRRFPRRDSKCPCSAARRISQIPMPRPANVRLSSKRPGYRYVEWRDWDSKLVVARELYDHNYDPHECRNVAAQPKNAATIREHAKMLDGGWQSVLPISMGEAP